MEIYVHMQYKQGKEHNKEFVLDAVSRVAFATINELVAETKRYIEPCMTFGRETEIVDMHTEAGSNKKVCVIRRPLTAEELNDLGDALVK